MESEEAQLIRKLLGLSLKDNEAKALVSRFTNKDDTFDPQQFAGHLKGQLESMTSGRTARELDLQHPPEENVKWGKFSRYKMLVAKKKAQIEKEKHQSAVAAGSGPSISFSGSEIKETSYYETILNHIRNGILVKLNALPKEDVLKTTFHLLSENRSPILTPSQLKGACLYRLNVALTDPQIAVIFEHLDRQGKGIIQTKELIAILLKETYGNYLVSVDLKPGPPKVFERQDKSWVLNQSAHVSYDHKFSGLVPPEADTALYIPNLRMLEIKIFDKIFERTSQGANMNQQLIKQFSDGRDKTERFGISRDQIRYTLWKSFQLNVSNEVIDMLFRRYDPEGTGYIPMQRFCKAIMAIGNVNEPLLEDMAVTSDAKMKIKRVDSAESDVGVQLDPKELDEFLHAIRRKFRHKINREGRAPHYLINSVERMTKVQAREYLTDKFNVSVSDVLLTELCKIYDIKGLFNMKVLLRDAMALKDGGKLGKDPSLLTGGTVCADERPSSLRGIRMTPKDIEKLFATKINERLKVDQPMASVHKIFKLTDTDGDVRFVNRAIMRNVLSKYDILPSDEDFEPFFLKHANHANGMIEVRSFLVNILAAGNSTLNPFLPKDPAEYAAQINLSKVLSNMTGKMRREVHGLNGPAHTRFVADESQGAGTATEEAKELVELAKSKHNQTGIQMPGHEANTTKVGFTPQPPSMSRPSPTTHIHQQHQYDSSGRSNGTSGDDNGSAQKPRRPISAPPSMQTTLFGSTDQHNNVNHHRSPRAKGHQLHVHHAPISSSSYSHEQEHQQRDNTFMGEHDIDGSDNERDLQAMKDELTRLSAWEDYEQQERSADQHHHRQQQPNDQHEHDHIDWSSFPAPTQDITTGGNKKGGRPYTPAANAVCAARRIPHFKNWKKTDPYQDLLKKRYKISTKYFTASRDEYGLFGKDLTKLVKKEQKLKDKYQRQQTQELN